MLAMMALLLALGAIPYGVPIPGSTFLAFVVYVALGTATLCCARASPSAPSPRTPTRPRRSRPSRVVILSFISSVFIPIDQLPSWLETVGKVFPLYHLALGLQTTLAPGAEGSGLDAGNVAVLAIWALAGTRIATRRFRWEPQAAKG